MKVIKYLKNIIIFLLLLVLAIIIFSLIINNTNKTKILRNNDANKYIYELKETVKKNISFILESSKESYSLEDLENEHLITNIPDTCDKQKSNIIVKKNDSSYSLEINLYCNNSYNQIKEEVGEYNYCDENATKQTEYEYKKISNSEIFDHYECGEGYQLLNNICIKKEEVTENKQPIPKYEDVINSSAAKEELTDILECSAGYTLENNECIKEAKSYNNNEKTCNEGYFIDGNSCVKPVTASLVSSYYCEEGILDGEECKISPIKKENEISYKKLSLEEISGEDYKKTYDTIDCHSDNCVHIKQYLYEDPEIDVELYCESGELVDNYCVIPAKEKKELNYSCIYSWTGSCNVLGFNQIGRLCNSSPNITQEYELSCDNGKLEGENCIIDATTRTEKTYSCEQGTLKGTYCETILSKIESYYCDDDYELKNNMCIKTKESIIATNPIIVNKAIKVTEYKWSTNQIEIGWEKTGNQR